MNFIKQTLAGFSIVFITILPSCNAIRGFFGSPGEQPVITTAENVINPEQSAPVPPEVIPAELEDEIPPGQTLVLTNQNNVKPGSPSFNLTNPTEESSFGILIDSGIKILVSFIPALAAYEGILALLFKRKRQHYSNFLSALIPHDNKIDFGAAIRALGAATGSMHSSKNTESTFKTEILDKLEKENSKTFLNG